LNLTLRLSHVSSETLPGISECYADIFGVILFSGVQILPACLSVYAQGILITPDGL